MSGVSHEELHAMIAERNAALARIEKIKAFVNDEVMRHLGKQCSCLGPGHQCDGCRMRAEWAVLSREQGYRLFDQEQGNE
jgi:hypothetical protein